MYVFTLRYKLEGVAFYANNCRVSTWATNLNGIQPWKHSLFPPISSFELVNQDFSMEGEVECLSIALVKPKERDMTISTQQVIKTYWTKKRKH